MKILLSAYACEPHRGSESEVGWRWAIELSRQGHEVWVLTRKNNKASIDAALADHGQLTNLNFLYYDLPAWARWWKKGGRGVRLYYLLWQAGVYRMAKHAHHNVKFDCVHHVTFVSVRQPSFMGNLGVPFIFGPVAGGEKAPWRLRFGYGLRGWLLDALRDVANFTVRFDPFMRRTFQQAQVVYVTSEQTKDLIPKQFRSKVRIQLAIGRDGRDIYCVEEREKSGTFRVLYVGRFLYWKGMHIGLEAFARLLASVPNARLTLVGEGPDERKWRLLVYRLGLDKYVDWVSWVSQKELINIYRENDVFLFPSLHDSGGMVVLEAMASGLPVICLDLGGPGELVNETCGRVVATKGISKAKVSKYLGNALVEIAKDERLYSMLSESALNRYREYMWGSVIRGIYGNANPD